MSKDCCIRRAPRLLACLQLHPATVSVFAIGRSTPRPTYPVGLAFCSPFRNHGCGTGTHRPGVWKLLQTDVCPMAHEDSLRLCGRGACDYVQAPKAKGPGTARFDGFPTPRSRVCKGSLRGRTANVSSLKPVEEVEANAFYVVPANFPM